MISQKIVLKFPRSLVNKPIICTLAKNYNVDFNILKAHVDQQEEGLLVLELKGSKEHFTKGMQYLKDRGVVIQPLNQDIVRNEDRCVHCGACLAVCPSGALALDRETWMVNFYSDQCIACEHCIRSCPPRAMEVRF